MCRSREEWLAADARNYVALDLTGRRHSSSIVSTDARNVCGAGATFAAERVCGCPEGRYYDVHEKGCRTLPTSLDREHLLLVLEYDHGGRKLVHRLGLYSFAECTSASGVGGYVTKGEQECVRECTALIGIDGKTCVPGCRDNQVADGNRCTCVADSIVTEDWKTCVKLSAC